MKEDKPTPMVGGRRVHSLKGFEELATLVRTIASAKNITVPEVLDYALPVMRKRARKVLAKTVNVGG